MNNVEQERFKLVNQVGFEAFQLIAKRLESLGELPFDEIFAAMVSANAVCFANTLRPAIEMSESPALAADNLAAQGMKQVRALLEPVVRERSDS